MKLQEYVKIGDDVFKIDDRDVCFEEKLQHDRHINFEV